MHECISPQNTLGLIRYTNGLKTCFKSAAVMPCICSRGTHGETLLTKQINNGLFYNMCVSSVILSSLSLLHLHDYLIGKALQRACTLLPVCMCFVGLCNVGSSPSAVSGRRSLWMKQNTFSHSLFNTQKHFHTPINESAQRKNLPFEAAG